MLPLIFLYDNFMLPSPQKCSLTPVFTWLKFVISKNVPMFKNCHSSEENDLIKKQNFDKSAWRKLFHAPVPMLPSPCSLLYAQTAKTINILTILSHAPIPTLKKKQTTTKIIFPMLPSTCYISIDIPSPHVQKWALIR